MPIDRLRSCKGLRIAALLAGTSLGAVEAYAVDGTWQGPGSEWTTGSNWSSGTVPDGVARFTTVGPTSISIAAPVPTINTIFFDAPASAYSITNNAVVNIFGTGIVNTSTNTQTITNNFLMTFNNSSTAGSATIINQTRPGGGSTAQSGSRITAPVAKRASSLFQVQVPPSTYRGSPRAA